MPYHVAKSDSCPATSPWAIIKDGTGEVMGCHMSEDDAMKQMQAIMANEPMMQNSLRKAVRSHGTATSNGAWDGPANKARVNSPAAASYFERIFAWYDQAGQDPDGDGYPDRKTDWRFIHHEVSADGTPGAANVEALRMGIGVLNGARGGTTIPDADRQGVYDHLAKHLRDAGLTPPELNSMQRNLPEGLRLAPERRFFSASELRATNDGQIVGHAAVFNQMSEEMWGFREVVKPGAFSKTIQNADVRALLNHDPNFVLGRTTNGTLTLAEDNSGLAVRITPPDTSYGADVMKLIKRGDISQMSFGFQTVTDNWRMDGGNTIRELLDVNLFDVSPVTFPAYPQTDVQVRSLFEARIKELRGAPHESPEAFAARMKARDEFIRSRTPAPDPLSFTELIKKHHIEKVS